MRSICSVLGCERPVKGNGFCDGHYQQFKKHGAIVRPILGAFEKRYCSVDGCNEPMKARGFCGRHSAQFYAHGKIISSKKLRPKDRLCTVEGCGRKHRANGYCEGHLQQFRKNGIIVSKKIIDRNGLTTGSGYVFIKMPDHKNANKRGYIRRSWLVWEEITGHAVTPPEIIHHINGVKNDDRFENLRLFRSDSEHQSTKHRMRGHFGVVPGGIII